MKHKIIEEIKKSIKSKYNISHDTKISVQKPKNRMVIFLLISL